MANALQQDALPQRIECFDISHSNGEATVASCVVFDSDGAKPQAYRRFNINNINAGDDYAAMRQVLTRRYQRQTPLPDMVLLDGGKGQLAQAMAVSAELGLSAIQFIAVAKGEGRKAGSETLIFTHKPPLHLPATSPALHLIQYIRDEAHRFAITAHRQRRIKARQHSVLQDIAGIGVKRQQQLLRYFGGLKGVQAAGIDDLAAVPKIGSQLAQKIYNALH